MGIVEGIERISMIELVQEFGFCKGSQIFWIHKFKNLPENQHKSRRQLEIEIVEMLRIPKCSKSTFDKVWSKYNRVLPQLLTREVHSKIEMFESRSK